MLFCVRCVSSVYVYFNSSPMLYSGILWFKTMKLNRLNDDVCFVMHTQNTSGYQYIDVIWAQEYKRYSSYEQLTPILVFCCCCFISATFKRMFHSKMKEKENNVHHSNTNAIVTWKKNAFNSIEFMVSCECVCCKWPRVHRKNEWVSESCALIELWYTKTHNLIKSRRWT